MAFKDVINNYANGATGQITTLTGESVGYSVSGNVKTVDWGTTHTQAAAVNGSGSNEVTVSFDAPVVGASVTLTGSNSSEKYLIRVDGQDVDLNTMIASGDATLSNVGTSATHTINSDGTLSGGHHSDGSIGQVTFHVPVSSIGVTGKDTHGWDVVEIGIEDTQFDTICFTGDTRLKGATGWIRADTITADHRLWTLHAGLQPVRWVAHRALSPAQLAAYPNLRPICIAKGALGQGLPHRDVRVSRQHRLLVSSHIVERVCGRSCALVPAFRLVDLPGIEQDNSLQALRYVHVLMADHHVLDADGAPAESLMPGPMAMRTLPPSTRATLEDLEPLQPQTQYHAEQPHLPPAAHQKSVLRRHAKNHVSVLQTYRAA